MFWYHFLFFQFFAFLYSKLNPSFTNARGDPVCCVIIIACSEITGKHVMGLQPWVDFIGDPEVDVAENSHGLDKY